MKDQKIIGSIGGWREQTWYVVEVSYRDDTPIHEAILFTGFLGIYNGKPAEYNMIVQGGFGESNPKRLEDTVFVRAIKEIYHYERSGLGQGNNYKLPTDPSLDLNPTIEGRLPDSVVNAFEEVRTYHPEVCFVSVNSDGRWLFTNEDFFAPVFDDRVDVGILDEMVNAGIPPFSYEYEFERQ